MTVARLLIADDHPLIVEALSLAARSVMPELAIDTAGTIAAAESLVRERKGYKLVLLDFLLPDARGFSGFMRLQHLLGSVPIAIVTGQRMPELAEAARALGAVGFLPKSQPLDEMARSIRTMLGGATSFPPASVGDAGASDARSRVSSLSGAQLRVLLALADGRLNKQIAGDLGITEATVKAHMTAIFRKLGVSGRTQALLAMQPLLGEAREPLH
ncbi:response regulator transcription factor [Sphingomonas solaris]|uniref:Response regulator transcription factor n=1 Tax=Alterirhizorhabdus solaris TaxID=2529389 RepID=A0A558R348_9SPHN|nr:response regulator transcription factor [Sphingomonas solaris]TVV73790.1 response regulator transcription factor [Sphingomonas solaris]